MEVTFVPLIVVPILLATRWPVFPHHMKTVTRASPPLSHGASSIAGFYVQPAHRQEHLPGTVQQPCNGIAPTLSGQDSGERACKPLDGNRAHPSPPPNRHEVEASRSLTMAAPLAVTYGMLICHVKTHEKLTFRIVDKVLGHHQMAD